MEIWKAAVLGIVQGLTEFLPVSSSGHLLLFERLLAAETGGADLFLGIVLHAGTLSAVLTAYAPVLFRIIKTNRKMLVYLLVATVPAAIVGVFLGDVVDRVFFSGDWLWLFFGVTAVILLASESYSKKARLLRPVTMKSAVLTGCAQAVAVIPGLSRSGTTIAAGLFCGLSREDAADFSFLMSIPVIGGALAVQGWKVFENSAYVSAFSAPCLLCGTLCSFVFGYLSLRLLRGAVKRGRTYPFAVYLLVLSVILAVCGVAF